MGILAWPIIRFNIPCALKTCLEGLQQNPRLVVQHQTYSLWRTWSLSEVPKRAYVTQADLRWREASNPLALAASERFFIDYTSRLGPTDRTYSHMTGCLRACEVDLDMSSDPNCAGRKAWKRCRESWVDRQQTVDTDVMTIFVVGRDSAIRYGQYG